MWEVGPPFQSQQLLVLPWGLKVCPLTGMPEQVMPATSGLRPQTFNLSSFHGCIRNLYINHELQDFTRGTMKQGVEPGCRACRRIQCEHGVCQLDGAQVCLWAVGLASVLANNQLLCLNHLYDLSRFKSFEHNNNKKATDPFRSEVLIVLPHVSHNALMWCRGVLHLLEEVSKCKISFHSARGVMDEPRTKKQTKKL